jgi:hypothetical protein
MTYRTFQTDQNCRLRQMYVYNTGILKLRPLLYNIPNWQLVNNHDHWTGRELLQLLHLTNRKKKTMPMAYMPVPVTSKSVNFWSFSVHFRKSCIGKSFHPNFLTSSLFFRNCCGAHGEGEAGRKPVFLCVLVYVVYSTGRALDMVSLIHNGRFHRR